MFQSTRLSDASRCYGKSVYVQECFIAEEISVFLFSIFFNPVLFYSGVLGNYMEKTYKLTVLYKKKNDGVIKEYKTFCVMS